MQHHPCAAAAPPAAAAGSMHGLVAGSDAAAAVPAGLAPAAIPGSVAADSFSVARALAIAGLGAAMPVVLPYVPSLPAHAVFAPASEPVAAV